MAKKYAIILKDDEYYTLMKFDSEEIWNWLMKIPDRDATSVPSIIPGVEDVSVGYITYTSDKALYLAGELSEADFQGKDILPGVEYHPSLSIVEMSKKIVGMNMNNIFESVTY